ncbi:MAG: EVE domain-containing protein [Xanthomonadaceae bacterium]|nr:EVE domain-containing protein [Xanthomonadaceae bacterium]MBU6476318.1 EVE domain-containing protein [Xanthomonadaceae bacterium]MDE2053465.1 EVE domain-containing protein [Xanthomonadaceae bacterium]MDE2224091.1 EVE domain-containing protein [Xanthomonadaceae bacterium]
MQRWLMKTEPDTFSIDDLRARKLEPWNGVRNYQARNFIRTMQRGDEVMIYHSSCAVPGVVGLAKVASAPYPDPGQFDPKNEYFDAGSDRGNPRWTLVDVRFVRKLKRTITLDEIKALRNLGDFALTRRGNRLSVVPVAEPQWHAILALE